MNATAERSPVEPIKRPKRYIPIEKHGVIGDRRTAALVGADGTIGWLCFPNFEGDVIFGALLDAERGGHWRLGPQSWVEGRQQYVGDSAFLRTAWSSADCELELVDAMLWPDRAQTDPRSAQRLILRQLKCVPGEAACLTELLPRQMFGAPIQLKGSSSSQSAGPADSWLGLWVSDPEIEKLLEKTSRASFILREGQELWMLLGYREALTDWDHARAAQALEDTVSAWHHWSRMHPYIGPRRDSVVRSVTTVRLLSFQPNGNQVAAPTCSLPEKNGGDRNYDYRYAWIRDSSLALAILAVMGDLHAAEKYIDWLAQLGSASEMPLQVLYRLDGGCHVEEIQLDDLEGYCESKPVRIGNYAFSQLQLDSFGHLADCALICRQQGGQWKPQSWKMIEALAEFTVDNWRQKDSGIWELSEKHHYVSSKAMSCVVLDRACRLAEALPDTETPARWQVTMDEIRAKVLQYGWSEQRKLFRQHYDSDDLDASVLLLATMGFLPADDPIMVSTVAEPRQHLEIDGFVWRFYPGSLRHPDMPLGGVESTFLPCTFWLASVLARMGMPDEAEAILDKVDKAFGQLGIYPEEADSATGAALANMPLLFSHA